jgi:hypothetical protein
VARYGPVMNRAELAREMGRNTEILISRGDQICRAEVYFGWNVD